MDTCAICGDKIDDGQDTLSLTEKGVMGINKASEACNILFLNVSSGQKLHVKCRKLHTIGATRAFLGGHTPSREKCVGGHEWAWVGNWV